MLFLFLFLFTAVFLLRMYLALLSFHYRQDKAHFEEYQKLTGIPQYKILEAMAYSSDVQQVHLGKEMTTFLLEFLIIGSSVLAYYYSSFSFLPTWATFSLLFCLLPVPFVLIDSLEEYFRLRFVDRKRGISVQTDAGFFKSKIREYLIYLIAAPCLFIPASFLLSLAWWPLYVLLLAAGWLFTAQLLGPYLSAYAMNEEMKPLPEGVLRNQIEILCLSAGFPTKNVFVLESEYTNQEAYFLGALWFRRVVLSEELIAKRKPAEVLAIVGHELGHAKHNHIVKRIGIIMTEIALVTLGAYWLNGPMSDFLGLPSSPYSHALAGVLWWSCILQYPISWAKNWYYRTQEIEADKFGLMSNTNPKKLSQARSALVHVYKDEMVLPNHPLVDMLEGASPSPVKRILSLRPT